MTVRIVTDSVADIPKEIAKNLGITVIPLYVRFGTQSYRDNIDMTPKQFYQRLVDDQTHPSTSAGSPGEFMQVYQNLAEQADKIISIHVSKKLSGVYETALQAKNMMAEKERSKIEVVDSTTGVMAQGLLVMATARLALQGKESEEIMALIEKTIPLIHVLIILDTVEYANLGGRVTKIAAPVLKLVKPVLTIKNGEAMRTGLVTVVKRKNEILDFVRKFSNKIKEMALEYAPDSSGKIESLIYEIKEKVETDFHDLPIYISMVSPVIGTHAGPAVIAVSLITE